MTIKENTLEITSKSFDNNSFIPKRHTGFGEDISSSIHYIRTKQKRRLYRNCYGRLRYSFYKSI